MNLFIFKVGTKKSLYLLHAKNIEGEGKMKNVCIYICFICAFLPIIVYGQCCGEQVIQKPPFSVSGEMFYKSFDKEINTTTENYFDLRNDTAIFYMLESFNRTNNYLVIQNVAIKEIDWESNSTCIRKVYG